MRCIGKPQWKAFTAWLSMTSNIAVIALLFLLDLRDLYYKVAWIGSAESFSFMTGSTSILRSEPLEVFGNRHLQLFNGSDTMDSGWPSFLARCETLQAMGAGGSTFFLSAMGTNCVLADKSHPPIARLIMTSDQRVDALVWASCTLLSISQRPSICHERIVSGFYHRYRLQESDLPTSLTPTIVGSKAEAELLRFLEMASTSFPLHRIICVEAFDVGSLATGQSRQYNPTIFGCGSPSSFRSEFIGIENPMITTLLSDKAWLTADTISIANIQFLIRQNCITSYDVHDYGDASNMVLQSHTTTNFSSFGQLYLLLILIDLTLLTLNCRSSLELVRWMSFPTYKDVKNWVEHKEAARVKRREQNSTTPPPLVRISSWLRAGKQIMAINGLPDGHSQNHGPVTPDGPEVPQQQPLPNLNRIHRRRKLLATMEAMGGATTTIGDEQLYSFFSRSLYRNPRVLFITLVSQLLSWLLVLPNAVVWTWSDSAPMKLQAYLSSIRCWVLILVLTNTLWSTVAVRVSERAAYFVTKRTFLTSIDIILVGSAVSFHHRQYIFAMSEIKWKLEDQRVNDVTSFIGGFLAHGNTLQHALDSVDTTPVAIFVVLYAPLVRILLSSLVVVTGLLCLKAVYFSRQRVLMFRRWNRGVTRSVSRLSRRISRKGSSIVLSAAVEKDQEWDEQREDEEAEKAMERLLDEPYKRLPLEEWLDIPIRATSLVRNGLRMESFRNGTRFIRPSCYLDFGLIVKRGVIHSRIGFNDSWKPKMTVEEYLSRVEHQVPRPTPPSVETGAPPPGTTTTTTADRLGDVSRAVATSTSCHRISHTPRLAGSQHNMQRKKSLHVLLS